MRIDLFDYSSFSAPDFPCIFRVNASAGSGKTSLLTAWYIRLLLLSGTELPDILAITFTNAATAEMKTRILKALKQLSFNNSSFSGSDVSTVNKILPEHLEYSVFRKLVDQMLARFSDFQVKTIDSFINTLVGVSSLDLGLNPVSEISTETSFYLDFCLQKTIEKYQTPGNRKLTDALDRLSYLFFEDSSSTGWLLKDRLKKKMTFLRSIELRNDADFSLTEWSDYDSCKENLTEISSLLLQLTADSPEKTFNHNFVRAVEKLADKPSILTGKQWPLISPESWMNKKNPPPDPHICDKFKKAYLDFFHSYLNRHTSCQLAVFRQMTETMNELVRKKNLLFIDELNCKIHRLVQSTAEMPFSYFLAGEGIRHYLIDEFQDTSRIQLDNLLPLIQNSLSETGSSLFAVGDCKQAIYRFSGGDPELFTELPEFFPHVENIKNLCLPENYRSGEVIIRCNNQLFNTDHIRNWLRHPEIRDSLKKKLDPDLLEKKLSAIYASSFQNVPGKSCTGYFHSEVIPDEKEEMHQWILKILRTIHQRSPESIKEIAILVRTGKTEEEIASFLLSQSDLTYSVYSEKSLDLREKAEISELISFLSFLNSPMEDLNFAAAVSGKLFSAVSGFSRDEMLNSLAECEQSDPLYIRFRNIYPDLWKVYLEPFFKRSGFLPPYDMLMEIYLSWKVFENFPECEGVFHRFSELVSDRETRGGNSLTSLTDFFSNAPDEEFRLKLSGKNNGISIMTMHKSKGLSFDIVLIPELELKASSSRDTEYLMKTEDGLQFFSMTASQMENLLDAETDDYLSEAVNACITEKTDSFTDEFNLTYVALTRARKELYLALPDSEDNLAVPFFRLAGCCGITEGDFEVSCRDSEAASLTGFQPVHRDSRWYENLVREEIPSVLSRKSIEKGNLIHQAFSLIRKIEKQSCRDTVILILKQLKVPDDDLEKTAEIMIRGISEAEELFMLSENDQVHTELEFSDKHGRKRIADRVVLRENRVDVLEIKTGIPLSEHIKQLNDYISCLSEIFPDRTVHGKLLYLKTDHAGAEKHES